MNDNAPEFESSTVRISVPENVEVGAALYAAHARDRDSQQNGVVRYRIVSGSAASGGLFAVDARLGHLTLTRHLDYETAQRHSLLVAATDGGQPPLSANLSVLVEVQDVNDNLPVFEQSEYVVKIGESLPLNSQVSVNVINILRRLSRAWRWRQCRVGAGARGSGFGGVRAYPRPFSGPV